MPKPASLRLVIFDLDGTLVDSQDMIVAAQGLAFAAHGLPPQTRQRALSVVGLSLVEAFTDLCGPDAPIDGLVESYKDAFHALRADPSRAEPFFPGALGALAALTKRDDVRLAVATGKSRRGAVHLLERTGFERHFASVQTADDHPSKPAPGMILAALADTGIAAENAVMVGDTTFDMLMARAAHVPALGVAWGYHPPETLTAAGADRIAADFADVLAYAATPLELADAE